MKRAYVVACLFAALSVAAAQADAAPIVLGPGSTSCTSDDHSSPGASTVLAIVQSCFGTTATALNMYYKSNVGGGEEGSFLASYNTVFSNSASDPSDAVISYLAGLAITCPDCYLIVKGGGPKSASPFSYFFDLGSWNGTDAIQLNGFWPQQGAISNIAIWGAPGINVPEPGMFLLFGTGVVGLVTRRLRRRAA